MMWLGKTRTAYLALMISILGLFVTGIAVAETGRFNPVAEDIEAAVGNGKLTREEADTKYLEMKECLAEGGNKFEMKGAWAPVSPEDIETKVQAAKRMPLPSSR